MGGTLSHANSKLSFSFDDYVQEREELASIFRDISKAATEHRQTKGKLQVINGASGVTAGVAGAVALALSPVTFGASVPAAAVLTTAILSNSLAAASLTSSVASYGFGRGGDEDIVRRLQNLKCVMDSIAKKDEEINALLKSLEKENVEPVIKVCHQLRCGHVHDEMDKEKRPLHVDLPLSVLKTQGILLGTHSIMEGAKQVREEEELETVLIKAADALDEETKVIRTLKNQFKYLSCLPGERDLPRGRLTYVDGGGNTSRIMVATFMIDKKEMTFKSDSSRVLLLPDGATSVTVHFELPGGTSIKKVNRCEPKQPWIKNDKKEYIMDVFDFDCGDGVDAVFMVKGTLNHSFVTRAWDFGRHPWAKPRSWEWWGNCEKNINELVPGLEKRLKNRNARYEPVPGYCGLDLSACGSCFAGSAAIAAAEA